MLFAFFASVLSQPSHLGEKNPQLWFLCNSSIEGEDVCSQKGLAAFSVYSPSVQTGSYSRPDVFYQLQKSTLVFSNDFCVNTLKLDSSTSPYVSGKFTGYFIPTTSGTYSFKATFTHVYVNGYYFQASSTALVDFDVDDNETKGDLSCEPVSGDGCYEGTYTATNCLECTRTVVLQKGNWYPLYCGLITHYGVPYSVNLTISLLYKAPDSSSWQYVTTSDSALGYSAAVSLADEVSKSKSSKLIIISVSVFVAVFIIVDAVVAWIVYKKKVKGANGKAQSDGQGVEGRTYSSRDRHQSDKENDKHSKDRDRDSKNSGRHGRSSNYDSKNSGRHSRSGNYDSRNSGRHSRSGKYDSRNSGRHSRSGNYDSRNSNRHIHIGNYDSRNRGQSTRVYSQGGGYRR